MQDVCPSIPNRNFSTGDRVILYLDEDFAETGYQEYIAVDDVDKCLQIPDCIPIEVAAMLPGSALSAYSAVMKAKLHIQKLQEVKCKYFSRCLSVISFTKRAKTLIKVEEK